MSGPGLITAEVIQAELLILMKDSRFAQAISELFVRHYQQASEQARAEKWAKCFYGWKRALSVNLWDDQTPEIRDMYIRAMCRLLEAIDAERPAKPEKIPCGKTAEELAEIAYDYMFALGEPNNDDPQFAWVPRNRQCWIAVAADSLRPYVQPAETRKVKASLKHNDDGSVVWKVHGPFAIGPKFALGDADKICRGHLESIMRAAGVAVEWVE